MTFLIRWYQKLVSIPLNWLVKSTTLPKSPIGELNIDTQSPIYYLLQRRSTSSYLMLKKTVQTHDLPKPKLMRCSQEEIPNGAVFYLQKKNFLWFSGKLIKKYQLLLENLINKQKQQREISHQIIPVSICWGRNPGREKSLLKVFFTDTENTSLLRKFFLMLFTGRDSFVRISKPINLAEALKNQKTEHNFLTKLTRTLRVHFHRNRRALMGPLISNRGEVIRSVIVSQQVSNVIKREAASKKTSLQQERKTARNYAEEIAASYSYLTLRTLGHLLKPLWNKIYDGIEVSNVEAIRQLAVTHELVYVPSHRSHADYLLLSYSLYHSGLVTPHIAAGINLNFWPAGSIFRRCGAFFLRRSFGGNKLYTAVFNEYIFELLNHGTPIKFFPEGGRSRSGKLLPAKTGLLSMIVQSALRGTKKPIAFVPVYIGYERMFEGKSYLKEMRGKEKKKESLSQVLHLRKSLKQVFGKVYLNFSQPIILNDYLDMQQPDWKSFHGQVNAKPGWLTTRVNQLATRLMQGINMAATLNSVSLVSLILLCSERNAIDKRSLHNQLKLLLSINKKSIYSTKSYTPQETPQELLRQAEKLGGIMSSHDQVGEIISTDYTTAGLLNYYRNNILHVFVVPSLIASVFLNRTSITQMALNKRIMMIFPLLKKDFFLPWSEDDFKQQINKYIELFIENKMLILKAKTLVRADEGSEAYNQLYIHSQISTTTLLRYAIVLVALTTLRKNNTRSGLKNFCEKLTQRITDLRQFNNPENFDNNLFQNAFVILVEKDFISINDDNTFTVEDKVYQLQEYILEQLSSQAKYLLLQSVNAIKDNQL